MSFQALKLHESILKAIVEKGYETPTPIQAQAIPSILESKDILGCAQTGTGKTAAFCIPILQKLIESNIQNAVKNNKDHGKSAKATRSLRPIRSLILSPTRELAIQIGENLKYYGKYTGLTSTVVCGGMSKIKQIRTLDRGIDILVATPGRLLDLMGEFNIKLNKIEIFVLDEADRMLDMGFIDDIQRLLAYLPNTKQSLFFSATMEPEIARLANTILKNPTQIKVTPVSSTASAITQNLYFIDKVNKNNLLLDILATDEISSCLIFTRTKSSADKVVKMLQQNKIQAEAIHGDKSQGARQTALINFKCKRTRVLVATDIAARGIDIDHLEFVINYEVPNVAETYVHRIGRTGRAGKSGTAISFCDAEEKPYLRDIEKLIGKKLIILENALYPLINNNLPKSIKPAGGRGGKPSSRGQKSDSGAEKSASESKPRRRFGDRKPKKHQGELSIKGDSSARSDRNKNWSGKVTSSSSDSSSAPNQNTRGRANSSSSNGGYNGEQRNSNTSNFSSRPANANSVGNNGKSRNGDSGSKFNSSKKDGGHGAVSRVNKPKQDKMTKQSTYR
jgi:ATP-dependent RNA helicase RhlE